MRRHYAPNTEPDVVLECGCVISGWGQIKVIGGGSKWWLGCDSHPDGPGKWGMQRVLREASLYESFSFHEWGRKAPKRRSNRAPKWMRDVPKESTNAPGAQHKRTRTSARDDANERLF